MVPLAHSSGACSGTCRQQKNLPGNTLQPQSAGHSAERCEHPNSKRTERHVAAAPSSDTLQWHQPPKRTEPAPKLPSAYGHASQAHTPGSGTNTQAPKRTPATPCSGTSAQAPKRTRQRPCNGASAQAHTAAAPCSGTSAQAPKRTWQRPCSVSSTQAPKRTQQRHPAAVRCDLG